MENQAQKGFGPFGSSLVMIAILVLASVNGKVFYQDVYEEMDIKEIWKPPTNTDVKPLRLDLSGGEGTDMRTIDQFSEYKCLSEIGFSSRPEGKDYCWGFY